jgi:hypothetical protein
MITLRVDEKALETVLKLAAEVEDRSNDEDIAIVYLASMAARACQEALGAEVAVAPI